jgi:hypothetical protein
MICGCNNQAKVVESLNTSETWDSSTILAMNLKKLRPVFDLRFHSTTINVDLFSEHIQSDTSFCGSFIFDRCISEKLTESNRLRSRRTRRGLRAIRGSI